MIYLAKIANAQGTFSKVVAANPVIGKIINAIVTPVVTFIFFVAMLIFVWGIFEMIYKGDDASARKQGQLHILWGVIGMFIMVAAFGIIRVIGHTVGVGDPFL
jgi:uncharacterized membrane protein YdbT with pleckstrin-like domain